MINRVYRIHFKNERCLLIETDMNIRKLIDLSIAIKLRFNDLIDYKSLKDIDRLENVLTVLEKFFKVKNVKEKYKYILEKNTLDCKKTYFNNYVFKHEVDNIEVIEIDLYNSFECNCINRYRELIEVYLENEEIDRLILSLKKEDERLYSDKINKENLEVDGIYLGRKISPEDTFILNDPKGELNKNKYTLQVGILGVGKVIHINDKKQ
ncbi:hypothetical protein [Clostridium perfringens]|uniref:hypothetical protein n=1 Tax=Clostridium perfringens TaxID=1502 RepID=UPI000D71A89F|nr:hypothetical protein [Clostridium perfringens]PWW92635.1 hypothetical protein CYK76_00085 [Clostridium perfringens]PWX73105.1 hypothetical protein CYK77_04285 [Clostridium perfringens]